MIQQTEQAKLSAMSEAHQIIECTRADYEARYSIKPPDGSIGFMVYSDTGYIIVEYKFMDAEQEIEILEAWLEV